LRGLSAENGNLVHISGSEIQENSGLEPVNFLEFCVLLGTDASPRIPGIGMVTGYKLIQKYGTIENILEN
jgi:flap endonuclease-1